MSCAFCERGKTHAVGASEEFRDNCGDHRAQRGGWFHVINFIPQAARVQGRGKAPPLPPAAAAPSPAGPLFCAKAHKGQGALAGLAICS